MKQELLTALGADPRKALIASLEEFHSLLVTAQVVKPDRTIPIRQVDVTAVREAIRQLTDKPASYETNRALDQAQDVAKAAIDEMNRLRRGINDLLKHPPSDVGGMLNALIVLLGMSPPNKTPIGVVTALLGTRARNCVDALNLEYVEDLGAMSDWRLLCEPALGRSTLREIREAVFKVLADKVKDRPE
jgi:hypothetical protein